MFMLTPILAVFPRAFLRYASNILQTVLQGCRRTRLWSMISTITELRVSYFPPTWVTTLPTSTSLHWDASTLTDPMLSVCGRLWRYSLVVGVVAQRCRAVGPNSNLESQCAKQNSQIDPKIFRGNLGRAANDHVIFACPIEPAASLEPLLLPAL